MTGKNILYYPQLSMYDKNTKELLPQADGNINMLRNTILEWKKHRPDDVFYLLLPSELNFNDKLAKILPPGTLNAVPIFYNSYVISARINRFNFPMNEFSSILKDIKIDLLFNDVIELTGNFKQMFKIQFGYEPKIISNIRHVDESIESDYILNVIDGIKKSNLVTILSESMKPKLREQMSNAYYNAVMANYMVQDVQVFEPSVSYTEIENYTQNAVVKELDKVVITFPGRLSIGEERRTNWDKFEKAILKLREKRQDFEVYLTDPNNSMSSTFKIGLIPWIKTIQKDRSQFLNLLNKTDIIVSLMDVEGFGGISIREALLFGCLPVIPDVHEYKKMAYDSSYFGFIESPISVDELRIALDWSIDFKKRQFKTRGYTKEDFIQIGKQFTIEEQFKLLLPKIEEVLK